MSLANTRMSEGRRPQFGGRVLGEGEDVFKHNAWDNVQWDKEQEDAAETAVAAAAAVRVSGEAAEALEAKADEYWDTFYGIHQNRFFKDRNWLFTEFPDLAPQYRGAPFRVFSGAASTRRDAASAYSGAASALSDAPSAQSGAASTQSDVSSTLSDAAIMPCDVAIMPCDVASTQTGVAITLSDVASTQSGTECTHNKPKDKHRSCASTSVECSTTLPSSGEAETGDLTCTDGEHGDTEENSLAGSMEALDPGQVQHLRSGEQWFGQNSTFRVLEVGCGTGSTVYPILEVNTDPGLVVYCCDLSRTAVNLVKEHKDFAQQRCFSFVCDVTKDWSEVPFELESLDIVTLIFVLSAIHPDKMAWVAGQIFKFLRPGGQVFFRDYGRYDMAQLRFKKGRCIQENFYVRGDGTRCYFFTQGEVADLFLSQGFNQTQNIVDRRLQVNRRIKIKMYRVWIQAKFTKPL